MKKVTLLLSLAFIALTACQKTETEWTPASDSSKTGISTPGSKANIGPVPNRFTQKVLVEGFTSANEGMSPMANNEMDNMFLTSGGTIIGVNIHTNDAFNSSMFNTLTDAFTMPYEVPGGLLNRSTEPFSGSYVYAPTDWVSSVTKELQTNPACGLAIRAGATATTANIQVHVGFADVVNGNLKVNVYLIENDLTGVGSGYDQSNHFNMDNRSTFYNLGDPIVGYQHNQVLKAVLTSPWGNDISPNIQLPGGDQVFNFTANVSGYDITKTHVVAFISRENVGTSIGKVLNVQSAQLNSLKNWD